MADPSEFQFIVTICTVSKFFVVSNLLWKKIKIQKFLKVTFSFKKWQQNEDLGRKYLSSSSHDHQMILKSLFSFRFGHTTVPPGIYRRDRTCNFRKSPHGGMALRLCSTWWDSQVFHLQDSNEIFPLLKWILFNTMIYQFCHNVQRRISNRVLN